jgi:hypothetical protein
MEDVQTSFLRLWRCPASNVLRCPVSLGQRGRHVTIPRRLGTGTGGWYPRRLGTGTGGWYRDGG